MNVLLEACELIESQAGGKLTVESESADRRGVFKQEGKEMMCTSWAGETVPIESLIQKEYRVYEECTPEETRARRCKI